MGGVRMDQGKYRGIRRLVVNIDLTLKLNNFYYVGDPENIQLTGLSAGVFQTLQKPL